MFLVILSRLSQFPRSTGELGGEATEGPPDIQEERVRVPQKNIISWKYSFRVLYVCFLIPTNIWGVGSDDVTVRCYTPVYVRSCK